MVMLKKVTKEEFDTFLANYKRKLNYDCYAVNEPPMITYNDFTLGKWPDSIVAKTWLYDKKKGEYFYESLSKRQYFVAELDENGDPIVKPDESEKSQPSESLVIMIDPSKGAMSQHCGAVEVYPDGTVTERYGVVQLGEMTWEECFKGITTPSLEDLIKKSIDNGSKIGYNEDILKKER